MMRAYVARLEKPLVVPLLKELDKAREQRRRCGRQNCPLLSLRPLTPLLLWFIPTPTEPGAGRPGGEGGAAGGRPALHAAAGGAAAVAVVAAAGAADALSGRCVWCDDTGETRPKNLFYSGGIGLAPARYLLGVVPRARCR